MGSIVVSNLGKAYKQYRNRWSRLADWFSPFLIQTYDYNWILHDVSFEINPGESVGILGVNGAGKSTLLKLIAGTILPTVGHVKVNGRIAALLELGMGFHPDFTGRQNIYMAAQLQGLSLSEVDELLDEILSFSDIGSYIDQPIRIYSSGMQMRLAFAVATAKRPDILIVDEALSVGDAGFQRKCFSRIQSFLEAGTTLLFVSHSADTVNKICNKALLLDKGRLSLFGDAKSVTQTYEKILYGGSEEGAKLSSNVVSIFDAALASESVACEYGNNKAFIRNFRVLGENNAPANVLVASRPFAITYDVHFVEDVQDVHFGMMIKTVEDVCVFGVSTDSMLPKQDFKAGTAVTVRFELDNNLVQGTYYINCGCNSVIESERITLHRLVDVSIVKVNSASFSSAVGLANLNAQSTVFFLNDSDV